MKFRGGYTPPIDGAAAAHIIELPPAPHLYIPLRTPRLHYSCLAVTEGDQVRQGQVLARTDQPLALPLPAPVAGTVRLAHTPGHIVLERNAATSSNESATLSTDPTDTRALLCESGLWPRLADGPEAAVADPRSLPASVLIAALGAEPGMPDVQAGINLADTAVRLGLQALTALSDTQSLTVVLSRKKTPFNRTLGDLIESLSGVAALAVPHRYPFDNSAQLVGLLNSLPAPVWHTDLHTVARLGTAIASRHLPTTRLISLAGPGTKRPCHAWVTDGYPLELLRQCAQATSDSMMIHGGIFSGTGIEHTQRGLDSECRAISFIDHDSTRVFMPFAQPGFSCHSRTRTFLSLLRPGFRERATTSLRGELRPCINCGFCEEICPAGILPAQLHRLASRDMLEQVHRLRIDRCVGCGLCTYVCTSKIDLCNDLLEAKKRVARELGHDVTITPERTTVSEITKTCGAQRSCHAC